MAVCRGLCLGWGRGDGSIEDRYRFLAFHMSMQYRFTRALRYAAITLLMAAGFEALEHLIFLNLAMWQSHIAAILASATIVFLLASVEFPRERK